MVQEASSTRNIIVLGSLFSIIFLIIPFAMANIELINRNITENKIRNNKSYLRQIIESSKELIAALDHKNCFQIFNKAYQEEFKHLFNKTLTIGMNIDEAFSEASLRASQSSLLT